ncbi:MAG: hypothetical protein ACLR7Z_19845 [Bilophila wadsworthia]
MATMTPPCGSPHPLASDMDDVTPDHPRLAPCFRPLCPATAAPVVGYDRIRRSLAGSSAATGTATPTAFWRNPRR